MVVAAAEPTELVLHPDLAATRGFRQGRDELARATLDLLQARHRGGLRVLASGRVAVEKRDDLAQENQGGMPGRSERTFQGEDLDRPTGRRNAEPGITPRPPAGPHRARLAAAG